MKTKTTTKNIKKVLALKKNTISTSGKEIGNGSSAMSASLTLSITW